MSGHPGPVAPDHPKELELTCVKHCLLVVPRAHPAFPFRRLTPCPESIWVCDPLSTSGSSMSIKFHFGKWDWRKKWGVFFGKTHFLLYIPLCGLNVLEGYYVTFEI